MHLMVSFISCKKVVFNLIHFYVMNFFLSHSRISKDRIAVNLMWATITEFNQKKTKKKNTLLFIDLL